MTDTYGLGAIASPPDPRDWQIPLPQADMAPTMPARFIAAGFPGNAILDQGRTPMCVAYASVGHKIWEERQDGRPGTVDYDEKWLYRMAQSIDGIPMPHDGTTIRAALRILKGYGVPLAGTSKPVSPIAAYYAVPLNETALKTALYLYGPLVIASEWYESWFKPVNGILPAPSQDAGGHAVLLFGWDDAVGGGSWMVRNSWGPKWGQVGNCYAPYRWYTKNLHDAWKVIDRKGDK